MLQNIVDFKAKSFLSERNTSTMAYEVKAVRALWDPSLSIPGTNRRGGWRCPTGTRYGGQITDRFGRSCGWGVARRIANQISDIGSRLENVDDARRGRRIARRERRILARLNPQDARSGRLERGLRGVAERLEGGEAPTPRGGRRRAVTARTPSVDAPETPRELTPAPRAPRRRRAPNLRESEQRRMDREIEQPGAPRTGEAPARRRRRAVVEATQKPKAPVRKPETVVEPKVVKPRRPKPKVDVREPDPALERLLDEEEEVSRRVRRGENVDIGDAPKDFALAGNGRWRKGDWYIAVDQNEDQVLGLTASNGQGRIVQARNFNELVRKMDIADRRPKPTVDVQEPAPVRRNAPEIRRELQDLMNAEDFDEVGKILKIKGNDFPIQGYENLRNEWDEGEVAIQDVEENIQQDLLNEVFGENFPDKGMQRRRQKNGQLISGLENEIETQLQALYDLENAPGNIDINEKKRLAGRLIYNIQERRKLQRENIVLANNINDLDNLSTPSSVRRMDDTIDSGEQSESPKPSTPKKPKGAGRKVDLNQMLDERFLGRYIREVVIPNDRIMIINDPANFPNGAAERKIKRAEAIQKINRANSVLNKIEKAIARGELSNNDFIERDGEQINIARVKKSLADYKGAWREVFDGNVFDTPAVPKAPARPKIPVQPPAPAAPAIDPIDAPFIAPDKKDIRKAPEALKHQPPKVEPAKFKAEQEQIIEEALLEIRDAASLNKFSLLVDQAIFNENEGRQGALRNFQKELTKVAEILKRDPGANIDALIAEQKRQYMANFQMRGGVANARTKLNELETQLRDKFIKLRTPPGNGAEEKERSRVSLMEDIANIKKSIGSYEGHLQLVDALEPEIRKASERIKQGFVFNPDATNIPKPTPADVKKKIKDQISAAIDRRQGKLAKYLEERYPNGGAQFQDMTPEKWRTLSPIQRNEYIKEAYSHPLIKGKNGKLYNAVASVNGGSVEVVFNEINAQGQIIRARIGTSSRSIRFVGGEVYQASMFISSKLDRGADIQTIYNQHAFLYLSKIGITKAKVNAADDGQYVWARVGFKRGSGLGRGDLRALEAPLKFYEDFGPGGLISNDAEYARIKSILTQAAGGAKFSHQDIIFALDDPTGDKPRMEYVKQWFKPNLGFPGGTLKFVDQKVGGTPPRRPRRARAPRVPANGGV